MKIRPEKSEYAIRHGSGYLCAFGEEDLITNDAVAYPFASRSNLGKIYELPEGITAGSEKAK